MWIEERYKANYYSHLNSLYDLDTHGTHQEGRDLMNQIRYDLLRNGRSVASLSITNSLR